MAERKFTLSVAQIQSLALKTMAFRSDHEVTLVQPHDDSMEIEVDVFNVNVYVGYEGQWEVFALGTQRDERDIRLNHGEMPKFWEWREGRA